MNRGEAQELLGSALAPYRARPYSDLLYLLSTQDTSAVTGPSGTKYQVEISAVWDGAEGGNLRVFGSIDNGGWRAFFPLTRDFILSPQGEFVRE